jgi:hypothetical protein
LMSGSMLLTRSWCTGVAGIGSSIWVLIL